MDAVSYMLWNKIKAELENKGAVRGSCRLDGTKSSMLAAKELESAGYIKIERLTKYELNFYCEALDDEKQERNL